MYMVGYQLVNMPVIPNRKQGTTPPQEVRFNELRVEPWEEGARVRIYVDITPFQQSPDISLAISNQRGKQVSDAVILESRDHRIVLTMHLRRVGDEPYTLRAELTYPDLGLVDFREVLFSLESGVKSRPRMGAAGEE